MQDRLIVLLVVVVVRRRDVLDERLRVQRRPDLLHHGVESVVIVRGVLDDSHAPVGLVDAVRAVNDVAVAHLVLRFHVAGVRVVHAVIEGVPRMRLQQARFALIGARLNSSEFSVAARATINIRAS